MSVCLVVKVGSTGSRFMHGEQEPIDREEGEESEERQEDGEAGLPSQI